MAKVESLSLKVVQDEYLGTYLTAGTKLTFAVPAVRWPKWMPSFVPALYGLKAGAYEMAGGFAEAFTGSRTARNAVFTSAGNDSDLGFPVIQVPSGLYPFQETESGALFHISTGLEILYADAGAADLRVLDTLDEFAKNVIRQALKRKCWRGAYPQLDGILD